MKIFEVHQMMREAKTLREKFVSGRAKTTEKETLKQTQISETKQSLEVVYTASWESW